MILECRCPAIRVHGNRPPRILLDLLIARLHGLQGLARTKGFTIRLGRNTWRVQSVKSPSPRALPGIPELLAALWRLRNR